VTDAEVQFICESLTELASNIYEWSKDYVYDADKNDYVHKSNPGIEKKLVTSWFYS
jgi:hypothetical protein